MPDNGDGTWTCDHCGEGPFDKAWSDQDALDEYKHTYGHTLALGGLALLCDECNDRYQAWYAELSEQDHNDLLDLLVDQGLIPADDADEIRQRRPWVDVRDKKGRL